MDSHRPAQSPEVQYRGRKQQYIPNSKPRDQKRDIPKFSIQTIASELKQLQSTVRHLRNAIDEIRATLMMPDASSILLKERLGKTVTITCDDRVRLTGTLLSFDRFCLVMQHDDKKLIHIRGKIHNIEV